MKQVTVFGASGKVGQLVVGELLAHGYSVVAFVHTTLSLSDDDSLRVVNGSVYDADSVAEAIKGSEAVISALGSWGTPKKDILTEGMKNIIHAAEAAGVKRVISLTGHGASAPGDKFELLHRISRVIFLVLAPKILKDGEEHINLLHDSKLNWSVLRSPVMLNFGNPNKYSVAMKRPLPLARINRHAVAKALVDLLETDKYNSKAPFIMYKGKP